MKTELQKLFDKFMDYCQFTSRLRSETLRGYKQSMKTFFLLMTHVQTPSDLTQENLTLFFKRLQTRKRIVGRNTEIIGVKDSTIAQYWSKLNSFFRWLQTREYIKINPLSKMVGPKAEYFDKKALKRGEVERILSAIMLYSSNSFLYKRDLLIVSILLYCGLRKRELLSLKTLDVDLERENLRVYGETSKSKRTRYIPMNRTLVLHLKDYLAERKKRKYKNEYLIVSMTRDKGLTEHGIKYWVNHLKTSSGVKFHLHQFRHTFAYNLGNNNVGIIKIQKLMGHTDIKMTQKYLRSMTVDDLRDDINKLSVDGLA